MSVVKVLAIKAAILSLCLFYAFVAVVANLIRRLIRGKSYFVVKERSLPPICLQDTAYGRHSYIQLKDIKLHYVENGDRSKPLMLFVHGFPEFWFSWRHQLKEFAKTHWVVAVDLRGYGDSDKPKSKSQYRLELLEKDICDLVKALNREKCILVAHDWGGIIAWNVATHHPNLVEKLVILNSPHPASFRTKIRSSLAQFFKSWYIFFFQIPYLAEWIFYSDDLAIFDRMFVDENKKLSITQEELEGFKYTFSRKGAWTYPINYYRQNFSGAAFFEKEAPVQKVTAKTLIIWGENDIALDNSFPHLAKPYVEDLTIKFVHGNHFIQQDNPVKVNALIAEFLNES